MMHDPHVNAIRKAFEEHGYVVRDDGPVPLLTRGERMQWFKSKTVWAAIVIGGAHAASSLGWITPEAAKTVEGIAFAVFGLGVRQAIAKNGEGK